MKLFLTAVLLFAASFCFAQSFVVQAVSNGQGNVSAHDHVDVYSYATDITIELKVEAQVTSDECWALAYYSTGSPGLWAESPNMGYSHEDFDSIIIQPWSSIFLSATVIAHAPPGEYAFSSASASW